MAQQNNVGFNASPGGFVAVNGITTAQVIKGNVNVPTTPGKLRRMNVQAPGSAGAWQFLDANWIGAYSGTMQYYVGQGASNGGINYICILTTIGNAPPNATYWAVLSPMLQFAYNAVGIATGGLLSPDYPFFNGLYLAAVPSAGSPVANVSFE